ncbi:MAG: nickel pincer cofactor biosynthesis protein LarC [Bacteroidota bacterium]
MRIAYFDAGAGVSGDMMLGALVDAGLGLDGLRRELAGLGLDGYDLAVEEIRRGGFRACKVQVRVLENEHHPHHGRKVSDIIALIAGAALRPAVKETAIRVFQRLGEAEARAHGVRVADTHLHEAGAVDALVDIVGTVAALDAMGAPRVIFSPLRLGFGTVQCAHGLLPVPAPAVAELTKGVPVYAGEIEGEMVTPTGAALAVTLADSFGPMPCMLPEVVGIGAGSAERALPNVLRLFLGVSSAPEAENLSELHVLEANLDDMNPELYDYLAKRLWAMGALDVWLTPIQMKKGRPGTLLSVLASPGEVSTLREVIFSESTTLGLRERRTLRYALAREVILVEVAGRTVSVKVGRYNGRVVQVAPEYEDCRRTAQAAALPLKRVYELAVGAAWELLSGNGARGVQGEDG